MYVVLALLLLGVLIIAHEGGHFWAARACGIGVQEFSMGMGPLIAKWQSKKGTQFSVRLLPIGGYCQFYGEDEDENALIFLEIIPGKDGARAHSTTSRFGNAR